MNKTINYYNSFASIPYWVFILIIFVFSLSYNHINLTIKVLTWSPPPESSLNVVNGHFLPQSLIKNNDGSTSVPFSFIKSNGELIKINCEPYPPENTCLYAKKHFGETLSYSNENIIIKYSIEYLNGSYYNVIYDATTQNKRIIKYEDRVKYIKNGIILLTKSSGIVRLHYKYGTLVNYIILLIYFILFVLLVFLPLAAKIVKNMKVK
jgi:hypothetical protein